ncbi:MAG: WbqC family protein [Gammaproteobacteria bacterium]|nr:WbqC family protein [Gammaproteobacteria bacterium]
MRVVISQSMYFPWVGVLEQLRNSDIFVHYDDVQFSKGSFTNRVQLKTNSGIRWLTLPLHELSLGQRIDEVLIDDAKDWRGRHREMLRQAYFKAPYRDEMLKLVDDVFSISTTNLSQIAQQSMMVLADYFKIGSCVKVCNAADVGISGRGSQRVLDIVGSLGGDSYITGHGAKNYLDHELFERQGVDVYYMDYKCVPYPQLHGDFTPYVTALDLVANCGVEGASYIQSGVIGWREFMGGSNERT